MKFEPTPLQDAWVITLEPFRDDRGYFARAFCRREFEAHGIVDDMVQCNASFNNEQGTLRGLHFQSEPASESKLIRCVQGALYDVIVDIRPESPTYLQYFGVELSADNLKMVYVPRNFAHGFLTLKPDTAAYYLVGEYYTPECEQGLRYDDPALDIDWPAPIRTISDKDRDWPLLKADHS
jgi:dTDP-4-dehydrorhamnose 3,5-epimerase